MDLESIGIKPRKTIPGRIFIDIKEPIMDTLGYYPDPNDDSCTAGEDNPFDLAIWLLDETHLTMGEDELREMADWGVENDLNPYEELQADYARIYLHHVWPHIKNNWEVVRRFITDDGILDIHMVKGIDDDEAVLRGSELGEGDRRVW